MQYFGDSNAHLISLGLNLLNNEDMLAYRPGYDLRLA